MCRLTWLRPACYMLNVGGHTCCKRLLVKSIHLWGHIHQLIIASRPACSWCLAGRYPAVHCICGTEVCSRLIGSCMVRGTLSADAGLRGGAGLAVRAGRQQEHKQPEAWHVNIHAAAEASTCKVLSAFGVLQKSRQADGANLLHPSAQQAVTPVAACPHKQPASPHIPPGLPAAPQWQPARTSPAPAALPAAPAHSIERTWMLLPLRHPCHSTTGCQQIEMHTRA